MSNFKIDLSHAGLVDLGSMKVAPSYGYAALDSLLV